ncbi:MAG: alcohol dehydrogenase catalytic domain-containing protein [Candidatus Eremiobacteraeota bacterium]|nr:alcohol dehydrogenase catalytic domain-containing protein [Candidatus Eremiobacteraeota bacterium]
MRVAMLVEPRRIELHEESSPAPPPGGVVVRVRAALTDGTDLKTYRRGHPKMPMPTRFGHEFCGDVIAVADGVESFVPGDAVMCVHTAPCAQCYWCRHKQEELCDDLIPAMLLGAYADCIAVPKRIVERNAFHKPPDVTYTEGAFLEPLACVVHSVVMLAPEPDAAIAILGNGGFGILHGLLLQRAGHNVTIFGRRPERVELAHSLGLRSIDTSNAPMHEAILQQTGGRGADALIECTGTAELWEAAPSLVRRGGTVSFFAGLPAETRVSFLAARLHYDEVRLVAPFHFRPSDVRAAFDLIAERALPLTRLVSHAYSLDQIATAFRELDAGTGLKFLIEP